MELYKGITACQINRGYRRHSWSPPSIHDHAEEERGADQAHPMERPVTSVTTPHWRLVISAARLHANLDYT